MKIKSFLKNQTVKSIGLVFALGCFALLILIVGDMVTVNSVILMFAGGLGFCGIILVFSEAVYQQLVGNRRIEDLEKEIEKLKSKNETVSETRKAEETKK